MKLADLPSGIHPPAEHKSNRSGRREKRQATRREFIPVGYGGKCCYRNRFRVANAHGPPSLRYRPDTRTQWLIYDACALLWPNYRFWVLCGKHRVLCLRIRSLGRALRIG